MLTLCPTQYHIHYHIPDIFSVSYDADDTAAKPDPSVPDSQPEPTPLPAPNDNSTLTSNTNQEPKEEESESVPVANEPMYENGDNGDSGPSWNAGQANGGNAHQYNDSAMEQEPAPIGIKEDG